MRGAALLSLLALAIAGCGAREAECSSDLSQQVLTDILRQELVDLARNAARDWDGGFILTPSEARAATSRLRYTLEDVRTSSRDPNSSKRFCEGRIKVSFPVEYITRAEDRREAIGFGGLVQLEDALNIERNSNSVSASIDYTVQPTDDGSELYAETDKRAPINLYLAEMLAAALAKPPSNLGTDVGMSGDEEISNQQGTPQPAAAPPPPRPEVRYEAPRPTVVVIDPDAGANEDF